MYVDDFLSEALLEEETGHEVVLEVLPLLLGHYALEVEQVPAIEGGPSRAIHSQAGHEGLQIVRQTEPLFSIPRHFILLSHFKSFQVISLFETPLKLLFRSFFSSPCGHKPLPAREAHLSAVLNGHVSLLRPQNLFAFTLGA